MLQPALFRGVESKPLNVPFPSTENGTPPMLDTKESRLDFIPLDEIGYNPAINARRETETDVTELAATIDAQNIGQPLLLRPAARGGYEPVDGGRRFRALKLLVDQGKLAADHRIPAYIRELDDAEAMSISLATVITRMDLHPADEALDFTDLVKKGQTPEDIAARFGIPLRRVRQRLAIGQLPKEILAALKVDELSLKSAQAFTLLRDPAHASKLFKQGVRDEREIRGEFSRKRVAGTSAEAAYVGRDAYVAAGGAVDEDLFSNNVWFADGKLLTKLFQKKLKDDEKAWLAEGWSFVVVEVDKTYGHKTYGWPVLKPDGKQTLTSEQLARVEQLKVQTKSIQKELDECDHEDDYRADEIEQRLDAAEAELHQLTSKPFTDAQKKKAGVAVRRGHNAIDVVYGVMKPAAAKKEAKAKASKQKARDTSKDPSAVRSVEPEAEADFTQALSVEMAKVMSHAMQKAIIANPSTTLRLAAAALVALGQFESPEGFAIPTPIRRDAEISGATADAHAAVIGPLLASNPDMDFAEIFKALADHQDLDTLIAHSLAPLFRCFMGDMDDMRPIFQAFDPDVAADWLPDAEFFKRLPRESLAAALGEAAIPGVTPSKKKKDLVEMAVRDLVPLGWLPKPLRTPSYRGPGSNAWADAHAAMTADQIVAQQQKEAEAA